MKKTIAILALAAVGIIAANAGVCLGLDVGILVPARMVVVPAPVVAPPPMPAPIIEVAPVCPVPGYVWVGGNWAWCDNHWVWTRGHWGPPAHWDRDNHWDRGHGYRAERHDDSHGRFQNEHGHR